VGANDRFALGTASVRGAGDPELTACAPAGSVPASTLNPSSRAVALVGRIDGYEETFQTNEARRDVTINSEPRGASVAQTSSTSSRRQQRRFA
jgi:hypothetical protein